MSHTPGTDTNYKKGQIGKSAGLPQGSAGADGSAVAGSESPKFSKRYRRLFIYLSISTALVSLVPLIIMTFINYHQYQKAFRSEMIYPISRYTSNTKKSLEFFLSERKSALTMIINDKSFDELCNHENLSQVLTNMKNSFGGFVDLGVIDSTGSQRSYVGPYKVEGKNYKDQAWFHEVSLREFFISDVFMGYRNFPHFVIAVKKDKGDGDFYILRATIDSEMLNQQLLITGLRPSSDAFLVNREGILQSNSRFYGAVLGKCPIAVPPYSATAEVTELKDEKGQPLILGYAYVEHSPFIFMLLKRPEEVMGNWFRLRNELLGFLIISMLLVVSVVVGGSAIMVNRIRETDVRQAGILHKMEYTNKMASIGRLAAGVAHEINNPLAIINEKAGLLKDFVTIAENFPKKERSIEIIEALIKSVERCSTITHRLLGFAKHMDIETETIHLDSLLKEVLGFLEKEAQYRNIEIKFKVQETIPAIESDRGQLQQVFLNILNNAFAAVDKGGYIEISIGQTDRKWVTLTITDNGCGIPDDYLEHIFEPFFTTKKSGTGLGLSITYGIVEKLGGQISVKSKVGLGTSVIVNLPVMNIQA